MNSTRSRPCLGYWVSKLDVRHFRADTGRYRGPPQTGSQGMRFRTPLLENPALNAQTGGRILLKAEPLQRTGSFKFRDAYNFLSQIPPDTRSNGVGA